MTQADLELLFRQYLDEPDPAGRYSSATVTGYLNIALTQTAIATMWPESRIQGTWNGNQENPLDEDTLKVLRAYVNGQPCIPTDISLMEGVQLEMYDQSGLNQAPEWKTLERAPYTNPAQYPVLSSVTGYPNTNSVPGYPLRPAWYMRGACIGFVPRPLPGSIVEIAVVLNPDQFATNPVNPTATTPYPVWFKDAIVCKACAKAMAADKNFQAAEYWEAKWDKAVYDPREGLCRWVKEYNHGLVNKPVPVGYRTFYNQPVGVNSPPVGWGWGSSR